VYQSPHYCIMVCYSAVSMCPQRVKLTEKKRFKWKLTDNRQTSAHPSHQLRWPLTTAELTRSSAVAEKPRDASCHCIFAKSIKVIENGNIRKLEYAFLLCSTVNYYDPILYLFREKNKRDIGQDFLYPLAFDGPVRGLRRRLVVLP